MKRMRCEKDFRSVVLFGDLPSGGWRRILALWGFAPVPFFNAFEGETEATRLAWVEDHLRAAEER
jgi:hypothetical protein